jgi:hypothetical protein
VLLEYRDEEREGTDVLEVNLFTGDVERLTV